MILDRDGKARFASTDPDDAVHLRDLLNETHADGYMLGLLDGIGAPHPVADEIGIPEGYQTEGRGSTATGAFLKGITAGARGLSEDDCPYRAGGGAACYRGPWLRGFQAYHERSAQHKIVGQDAMGGAA